jgi:hypothetical protein
MSRDDELEADLLWFGLGYIRLHGSFAGQSGSESIRTNAYLVINAYHDFGTFELLMLGLCAKHAAQPKPTSMFSVMARDD